METRWEGKRKLSGFQVRRLPRVLTLQPPLDPDDLHADWRNGDLFLVAEEEGVIVGYLDMVSPPAAEQRSHTEHCRAARPAPMRGGFRLAAH